MWREQAFVPTSSGEGVHELFRNLLREDTLVRYKGGEELFRYIPPHLKRIYKGELREASGLFGVFTFG